jgi:hypothetical protein
MKKLYQHRGVILLTLLFSFTSLACQLTQSDPNDDNDNDTLTIVTVVVTNTPAPDELDESPPDDAPALDAPSPEPGVPTMTTRVDLNVRRGPGLNYDIVGFLPANTSATINGRSPDGFWWRIDCPAPLSGECWSSAREQYSNAENVADVPVAAVPPSPTPTYTPTPTATATLTPTPTPTSTSTATPTLMPPTATPTTDPYPYPYP